MTDDVLVRVKDLSGGYGETKVIDGISLEIERGDFLGIIGPNGSGKSTLLKLMSRILVPQRGSVLWEGTDIRHIDLKKLSQKAAFVPQDTLVNFAFTAEEIVLMGRIPYLRRWQHERKTDILVAQKSMILTDTAHLKQKNINELSAGERQRVIMAKALAQEPVILFLDEPTTHLDIGHQVQMLDLLKKLNKQNLLTVVVVLHDLNLASEYCDRIILLENGRIFKEGAPADVLTYQNIESVYKTAVVVAQNPVSRKPYCILIPEDCKKP